MQPDGLLEALRKATQGDYRVVRELGRGGMAAVYLAHDLKLGRDVAIKVMMPYQMGHQDAATRFLQEARTAARLDHPNIIPIHSVHSDGGLLYFVMKCIQGRPLDAIIDDAGALDIPLVREVLSRVAGALAYAHGRQVIHRDIKPANIMIDMHGSPIVMDFGIAKVPQQTGLTRTGAAIGTPKYMSPEQCRGEEISGASDQYSLGIVAFQMLTGNAPFDAPSIPGLMLKQISEPLPSIRDVRPDCPADLETAVERMLEKDPADRWPTMRAAVRAIEKQGHASPDRTRTAMIALVDVVEAEPSSEPGDEAFRFSSKTRTMGAAELSRSGATPAPPAAEEPPALPSSADESAVGAPDEPASEAPPQDPAVGTGKAAPVEDVAPVPSEAPAPRAAARKRPTRAVAVAAVVVALLLIGVFGVMPALRGGVDEALTAGVEQLALSTAESTLEVLDTVRLGASAFDADDRPVQGASPEWESADPRVARVSRDGLITAVAAGTTEVTASIGSVTARATIHVRGEGVAGGPDTGAEGSAGSDPRPGVAASVTGLPGSIGIGVGERRPLSAVVRDGLGDAIPGERLSWDVDDPSVARIESTAGGSQLVALAPATTRIRARAGTIASAWVPVTISAPARTAEAPETVEAITVSPPDVSVEVGESTSLRATVRGSRTPNLSTPVEWRSNAPAVATVDASGTVRGVGAGSAEITAAAGGRSVRVRVTVSSAAVALTSATASFEADPDASSLTTVLRLAIQGAPTASWCGEVSYRKDGESSISRRTPLSVSGGGSAVVRIPTSYDDLDLSRRGTGTVEMGASIRVWTVPCDAAGSGAPAGTAQVGPFCLRRRPAQNWTEVACEG